MSLAFTSGFTQEHSTFSSAYCAGILPFAFLSGVKLLHKDKTQLIRFGRFAKSNLHRLGRGKPETFEFLGFTHFCSTGRNNGFFSVARETSKKRMRATLRGIKTYLLKHRHDAVLEQLKWLKRVVKGI